MAYGEDDMLNILEASGLRAGDHGSGATADMVAEVFRLVSRLGTCREELEKEERVVAAEREEARVSQGGLSGEIKREDGVTRSAWSL
jgi:hypothetical protein